MPLSPFELMQNAVEIVNTSPHVTNKIAATLSGTKNGVPYNLSRTNYWPPEILEHFGTEARIGNSSGTIHAETACILASPQTENADLFITDIPCPNCVKNMAEAGIGRLFIDHKGFNKDFALRRGHHFKTMAMQILEKAGISVYEIWRKEQRIVPILEMPENFVPASEKPPRIQELSSQDPDKAVFEREIKAAQNIYDGEPFALALAENVNGSTYIISAQTHLVIGYTEDSEEHSNSRHCTVSSVQSTKKPADYTYSLHAPNTRNKACNDAMSQNTDAKAKNLENGQDKYSFYLQPANRILMTASRHGLKLRPGFFFTSQVPTSREWVNLVGAHINQITIGDHTKSRDTHGLTALEQLKKSKIIEV